jgi:hypothetical protein
MLQALGSAQRINRRRRAVLVRLFAVASVTSVGVLASAAGSASADGVPNHDHFLTTPSGDVVQVGPPVCEHPDVLHEAFHNFHDNVHTGAPTSTGAVAISRVLC